MKIRIGDLLYVVAIAITAVVVAAKYFSFGISPVTGWIMADSTRSLLIALVLAILSRWL